MAEQRAQTDTVISSSQKATTCDGRSRSLTDERLRDSVVRVCVEIWLLEEELGQLLDQERAHLVAQRAVSIEDPEESLLVVSAGFIEGQA